MQGSGEISRMTDTLHAAHKKVCLPAWVWDFYEAFMPGRNSWDGLPSNGEFFPSAYALTVCAYVRRTRRAAAGIDNSRKSFMRVCTAHSALLALTICSPSACVRCTRYADTGCDTWMHSPPLVCAAHGRLVRVGYHVQSPMLVCAAHSATCAVDKCNCTNSCAICTQRVGTRFLIAAFASTLVLSATFCSANLCLCIHACRSTHL